MSDHDMAELRDLMQQFRDQFLSVILSTVDSEGQPEASYAPCYRNPEDGCFYIFVSALASHTSNLLTSGRAGLLFVEDEAKTRNIFKRQRLSYACTVSVIEREDKRWEAMTDALHERCGNSMKVLKQLNDFHLCQLAPHSGRYVAGFGKAYDLVGEDLGDLLHLSKDRITR